MVERIKIGYDNTLLDAATLAGGSWEAGLPLANLKTDELAAVARSTDDANASTKLTVDFGSAVAMSALFAGPTNLSPGALTRLKGAPSNAFATGYDSGWVSQGLTTADLVPGVGPNIIHILSSVQTYQWWQLEIDDTSNVDGYVQIGRLFMPKLLEPSVNYSAEGNSLSLEDMTRREETISGVENSGRRRNRRVFSFRIPELPENEAFNTVFKFQMTVGFDQLVFLVPDPAAAAPQKQLRSFWGRVRAMDPVSQALGSLAGVGLTVSEVF